jgi:hypothetical protein
MHCGKAGSEALGKNRGGGRAGRRFSRGGRVEVRVPLSTLRYHIYKACRVAAASPRLRPVRIEREPMSSSMLQAHVGAVRVSFAEGCSLSYVAAVLSALSKASC